MMKAVKKSEGRREAKARSWQRASRRHESENDEKNPEMSMRPRPRNNARLSAARRVGLARRTSKWSGDGRSVR